MRVGKLTKMSFIFASRVSSLGSDLFWEGNLCSLASNGLNVLGSGKGISSRSEVGGSTSVDDTRSSISRDRRLRDLSGTMGELELSVSEVPARDLATTAG
jgi:hypothetical protein